MHGPASVWPGPGWEISVEEKSHGFAAREIVSVGSSRDLGYEDPRDLGPALQMASAGVLRSVLSLGTTCSFELRYLVYPQAGGSARLRLLLRTKALTDSDAEATTSADTVADTAVAHLPSGFVCEPVPPTVNMAPPDCGNAFVEVRKQEEVTRPLITDVPSAFYYAAYPVNGDGRGWSQFFATLVRSPEPLVLSLLFIPTYLDPAEQETIGYVASLLRHYSQTRSEQNLFGTPVNIPGDANASAMLPTWEHYLHRLRHSFLARMSVRGNPHAALVAARALATAAEAAQSNEQQSRSSSLTVEPAADEWAYARARYSFEQLEIVPWGGHPLWQDDDAPHVLRRLPYLYSVEEAASVAILPVPDQQGAIGFARSRRISTLRPTTESVVDDPGAAIALGRFLDQGAEAGQVRLPLTAVNRHALIVGAPNSGKTTCALTMLVQLWRDHRIPFLAIEPTKVEYRALAKVPGMGDLQVFTPGKESISPLRLNPLAIGPGMTRQEHQSAVLSALKASMPLFPPLPELLEEALDRAYQGRGWGEETKPDGVRVPPTLSDLMAAFEAQFATLEYTGEARNMLEALRVRLRSLMRGSKGKLLNTVESTDWDELMTKPVVIELDAIGDPEEKAIVAAFILKVVTAHARGRGNTNGELRHVTLLEEAHQLLSGEVEEGPRRAAVQTLCNGIAELRSVGEGFILADQRPVGLAPAAVANCAIRIVHKLLAAEDRELLLADADASYLLREAAARFKTGEALLSWPGHQEAELVRIHREETVDPGVPFVDEALLVHMESVRKSNLALLPFHLCSRQICLEGCDPARRSASEAIAAHERNRAPGVPIGPRRAGLLASTVSADFGSDRAHGYCAAVQLVLGGGASMPANLEPEDFRELIIDAVDSTGAGE